MLNAARREIKGKFEVRPGCCQGGRVWGNAAAAAATAAPPRPHLQAAKADRDPAAITHRLAEGEEANEFIRTCIVQTRKTDDGGFGERSGCVLDRL